MLGATSGSVAVSGCLGSGKTTEPFETDETVSTIGRVPVQDKEIFAETKAEDGFITEDFTSVEVTRLNTTLNAEITGSWFYSGERDPREGIVTVNSTVVRETYWTAPDPGE